MESTEPTPSFEGTAGGGLQEDVATQAELERVRDPDGHEGVDKEDEIKHGQDSPSGHAPDKTP